jgi:hypothetical protein
MSDPAAALFVWAVEVSFVVRGNEEPLFEQSADRAFTVTQKGLIVETEETETIRT